jgi:tape measure domain-containing protein
MADFTTLGIRIDTSQVRQANKDLTTVSRTSKVLSRDVLNAGSAFKHLAASLSLLSFVHTVTQTVALADKMTLLESRIRVATKTNADYVKSNQMLVDMSMRTGTSFEANTTIFFRANKAIEKMGGTIETTARFTETLAKALTISGATAGETNSVIRQMSQALASGILRGDEFNSIAENGARIQQVLAESLGKSAGELRKMSEHGELSARKVLNAMLKMSATIDEEFAQMPVTVARAMQNIDTAFGQYIASANKVSGATTSIAAGLDFIAHNMSAVIDTAKTLAYILMAVYSRKLITSVAAHSLAVIENNAATEASLITSRLQSAAAVTSAEANFVSAASHEVSAEAAFLHTLSELANSEAMVASATSAVALARANVAIVEAMTGATASTVNLDRAELALADARALNISLSADAAAAEAGVGAARSKTAAATAALSNAEKKATISTGLLGKATSGAALAFGLLNIAVSLVIAGFAGWQLGSWLRENVTWVRVLSTAIIEDLFIAINGAAFAWQSFLHAFGQISDISFNEIKEEFEATNAALIKARNASVEFEKVNTPEAIKAKAAAITLLNEATDKAEEAAKAMAEAIKKEQGAIIDENIALTISARAYEEYRLAKIGFSDGALSAQLAIWDTNRALEAGAEAQERNAEATKSAKDAVLSHFDALIDENKQLTLSARAYELSRIQKLKMSKADELYAISLWEANRVLKGTVGLFGKIAGMSPFKKAKADIAGFTTDELQEGINNLVIEFDMLQEKANEMKLADKFNAGELKEIEEKLKAITNHVRDHVNAKNKISEAIRDNNRNYKQSLVLLGLERDKINAINGTLLDQTKALREVRVEKEKIRLVDQQLNATQVKDALTKFKVVLDKELLNGELEKAQQLLNENTLRVGIDKIDGGDAVLSAVEDITNIILDFMEKQRKILERKQTIRFLEEEIATQANLKQAEIDRFSSMASGIKEVTGSFSGFTDEVMISAQQIKNILEDILRLRDAAADLPGADSAPQIPRNPQFGLSGDEFRKGSRRDVSTSSFGIQDEGGLEEQINALFDNMEISPFLIEVKIDSKGIKKDLGVVSKDFKKTFDTVSKSENIIEKGLVDPIKKAGIESKNTGKIATAAIKGIETQTKSTAAVAAESPIISVGAAVAIANINDGLDTFEGKAKVAGDATSGVSKGADDATSSLGGLTAGSSTAMDTALNAADMIGGTFGALASMYSAQAAAAEEGSKEQEKLQRKSLAMTLISATVNGVAAVIRSLATGGWPEAAITAAAVAVQLAFIGAQMATLGASPGPSEVQQTQGKGTVLGDSDAFSESLGNGMELLEDYALIGNEHSSRMLISLQNIDNNTKELGLEVGRSKQFESFANDPLQLAALSGEIISLGFDETGFFEGAYKESGIAHAINKGFDTTAAIFSGGVANAVTQLLTGDSENIKAAGISIGAPTDFNEETGRFDIKDQTFGDILKNGAKTYYYGVVDQFTSIQGLAKMDSFTANIFAEIDGTISNWLNDIINDTVNVIIEGSKVLRPLDNGDVLKQIEGLVLSSTLIDFKGLDQDEINEAISAYFSAEGDKAVEIVFPELDAFQQVGEGLFETFVRVTSEVEQAENILSQYGLTSINFMDVQNKQNDVLPQMVRQTILANTEFDNVHKVMESLAGDGEELASTWMDLRNTQLSLMAIGAGSNVDLSSFAGASGGVSEMQSNLDAYIDGFLTSSEKAQLAFKKLNDQFTRFGVETPRTIEEFNALKAAIIEQFGANSEAGAKWLANLLSLAPAWLEVNKQFKDLEASLGGLIDSLERDFNRLDDSELESSLNGISDNFIETLKEVISAGGSYQQALASIVIGLSTGNRAVLDAKDRITKTFEDFNKALGSQKLSITDDITRITNPDSLAEIQKERLLETMLTSDDYDEQLSAASSLQSLVMSNYEEQISAAESLEDSIKSIRDYLKSILLNESLTTLTPGEQLTESQNQFSEQLELAQGGDLDALANITTFADEYLTNARDFFASGDQYTQIFDMVTNALEGLTDVDVQNYDQVNAEASLAAVSELEYISDILDIIKDEKALDYELDLLSIDSQVEEIYNEFIDQIANLYDVSTSFVIEAIALFQSGQWVPIGNNNSTGGGSIDPVTTIDPTWTAPTFESIWGPATTPDPVVFSDKDIRSFMQSRVGTDPTQLYNEVRGYDISAARIDTAMGWPAGSTNQWSISYGFQPFAKGGIATEASIFGEAGAEAAVPLPDGRTIPVTINQGSGLSYCELIDEVRLLRQENAEHANDIIQSNFQASEENSDSINSASRENVDSQQWEENKTAIA